MTTQTATFTLPESHLLAAQEVVCAFALMQIGPFADDDVSMREVLETLETISALHTLGAPGEPIEDEWRDLPPWKVDALRDVAAAVKDMGEDMAVNGYSMDTEDGRARAAYKKHLAEQAHSLILILP